jgi:hypothetical protein
MTMLPAAPAMATLAGAMHPDAPKEIVGCVEMQAAVLTEAFEAAPNGKVNVALRC